MKTVGSAGSGSDAGIAPPGAEARRLVEIAVPLPFYGTLTFDAVTATRHPVVRGSRVLVAVRGRKVIGVCTGETPANAPSRAPEKASSIKPVLDALDSEPVFLPICLRSVVGSPTTTSRRSAWCCARRFRWR